MVNTRSQKDELAEAPEKVAPAPPADGELYFKKEVAAMNEGELQWFRRHQHLIRYTGEDLIDYDEHSVGSSPREFEIATGNHGGSVRGPTGPSCTLARGGPKSIGRQGLQGPHGCEA